MYLWAAIGPKVWLNGLKQLS